MVEIDKMSDNESYRGFAGRVENPRLTKQKSSSGLFYDRGRGSTLGLGQGLRSTATDQ
jgi:hypothetical protein